jgi:glycerate 2-kinase
LPIVSAAVAAADAGLLVERALATNLADRERYGLVAIGKAAPRMAAAAVAALGSRVRHGIAIGTHDQPTLPPSLMWLGGSHPVPDDRSVIAGRAALSYVTALDPSIGLLILLSGGASALAAVPAEGLTLEDKQAITRRLLAADVPIHQINAVRKHLSAIKGGRLAAATQSAVLTLAVSDVVGDDPSVIGSGPSVADASTFAEALAVIDGAVGRDRVPGAVRRHLARGVGGEIEETPKPGDPRLAHVTYRVVGSSVEAVHGAAAAAAARGYGVITLTAPVVGEARTAAAQYVATLRQIAEAHPGPTCVLSAGETTVRVIGHGRGGRNQEFTLALVQGLGTMAGPMAICSVGTDGIDGPTDAAGAFADSTTLERASVLGLDPIEYLEKNDAWSFFDRLGDLVRTGRTNTNVGDLQVALIG